MVENVLKSGSQISEDFFQIKISPCSVQTNNNFVCLFGVLK